MKYKKIKAIVINPENDLPSIQEIGSDSQSLQDVIGTDVVHVTETLIGGQYYDVVYDDMGLGKGYRVSAIGRNGKMVFAGTIIICSHDKEGYLASLTDTEIMHVLTCCMGAVFEDGGKPGIVLSHVQE